MTLTEPANTDDSITVAYYGGADKSVDINSGRGYTRDKRIKLILQFQESRFWEQG